MTTAYGELAITPTTTVAAEAANNTGASNTFKGLSNGVTAPGNVSKLPTRSLLYSGATTKVYAHFMSWFGSRSHIDVGYVSNDPAQIRKQVNDMISRGLSGVIASWDDNSTVMQSVPLVLKEVELHPGFEFAFEEEVQSLKHCARASGCDVTEQLIKDLTNAYKKYETSASYMRVDGRPVVFYFGGVDFDIDWQRVRESVPGNPLLVFRNPGAFALPHSDGAFAWSAHNKADPSDEMLSYLDTFYSTAQRSRKVAFGSVYPGFNDSAASWGQNKITQQHCGRTWLDTFRTINKHYSASKQLPYVRIVTWNDYEEGTAIEPGIDNCLSVSAEIKGNTLRWSVSGSEDTVHDFTIFISRDGQNLMKLTSLGAKTHSLNLADYDLSPGTYFLYVEAIGQPSILNKMSNPTKYILTPRKSE